MELDMADPKASVLSFFTIGIMAVLFIVGAKWALARWPVHGLTELVNAA